MLQIQMIIHNQTLLKNILLPPSELMSKVSVYIITILYLQSLNLLIRFSSNLFIKLFINLLIKSLHKTLHKLFTLNCSIKTPKVLF